jgi:23S rRNA pseudouridine2605 synthase
MRQKSDLRKTGPGIGAGERIAKVIARAGLASRREAEAWVQAGRVRVNGKAIESPAHNVQKHDRIEVDGNPLRAAERTRLFLYHKPKGLVTTNADPEGRPTIFQHLPAGLPRVVTVGRLDITSEGLLLLTNDGGLARTLELPATGWLRRYRVRANGRTDQPTLDRLRKGVTVEGVAYGAVEATIDREQGANLWLTVGIREGKNREVRKVLAHVGLKVNRLIRIAFGPFELGALSPGAAEEVKTAALKDTLGAELSAAAHADFASPLHEPAAPPPKRLGRTESAQAPMQGRSEKSRGTPEHRNKPERNGRKGGPQRERFEQDRDGGKPTRARKSFGTLAKPASGGGTSDTDAPRGENRPRRPKGKRRPFRPPQGKKK